VVSRYPFSRDTLRPNVKSHDCSRNNSTSRDSSLSRASSVSKVNKTTVSRFNSLPKNPTSIANKGMAMNLNNKVEFGSACTTARNSVAREREGILTRVSLPARQSCDTPPSRYGARKTNSSRNNIGHNSNSLPRQFGKTQPHLISSTNLTDKLDKFDESRHAMSLERPAGGSNSEYGMGKASQMEDALKIPLKEGIRRGEFKSFSRPKSEQYTKMGKLMGMYGHLGPMVSGRPDDVFSVDSGYPASEALCSGNCRKVLNITADSKCLCHLLKQKNLELEQDQEVSVVNSEGVNSEDFENVSIATEAQNLATNARFQALEQSLLQLISKVEGRKSFKTNTDEGSQSDLSSSVCDFDISKWKPTRSNSISEMNPSTSFKNRRSAVNKRLSSGVMVPGGNLQPKPSGSSRGLDAMFLEDHTQRHHPEVSPSISSINLSSNDGWLKHSSSEISGIDCNNLSDVTVGNVNAR